MKVINFLDVTLKVHLTPKIMNFALQLFVVNRFSITISALELFIFS